MQVNGDINFTGTLTVQGRDIKSVLDNHYELGLILVRGLIGGGYVGSSVWSTLTLLSYATDAWATSANALTFSTNYGGWASAHAFGYVMQGSASTVNKIIFATEAVSTSTARTNGSYSPSLIQQGVGYETTGTAFGRYAYTCGNGSTSYDKLDFTTDSMTARSDANIGQTQHAFGWFDKEYGWNFSSAGGYTKIYPFASESWSTLGTVSSPQALGMPGSQLEKGVNTKKGKAYVCGVSSWYNNTIFQFRNNISTWTTNFGSQTQPNTEHAGTMGQNHGYLAGGYQAGGYNQNAHTDKVKHDTDTVVQIADAPRALSSASPMWSPI
jgi:hypothetical protein